jgi:hypothetical protein
MTPTLMDVVMITDLDIASPSPSAYNIPEVLLGFLPNQSAQTGVPI